MTEQHQWIKKDNLSRRVPQPSGDRLYSLQEHTCSKCGITRTREEDEYQGGWTRWSYHYDGARRTATTPCAPPITIGKETTQ